MHTVQINTAKFSRRRKKMNGNVNSVVAGKKASDFDQMEKRTNGLPGDGYYQLKWEEVLPRVVLFISFKGKSFREKKLLEN